MKPSALALTFLLAGTAFNGTAQAKGGARPPEFDELRGLTGQAFDLAWLTEMLGRQEMTMQASAKVSREGERETLRAWAAKDFQERQIIMQRLQALKNQLQLVLPATCPECAVPISDAEGFLSPLQLETRLLNDYPPFAAQTAKLARLGLSKSQNPALRREAAHILIFEAAQINELKGLK